MARRAMNRSIVCNQCGRTFNKLSNLKRHLNLHSPKIKRLKCKLCNKTYQNMSNYKLHWSAKHDVEFMEPTQINSEGRRKENIYNHHVLIFKRISSVFIAFRSIQSTVLIEADEPKSDILCRIGK